MPTENFFTDNPDLLFQFEHLDWDELIRVHEDDFAEKDLYAYAPSSVEDAKDSYRRVLEVIGSICAEYIAPYAAQVDEEGARWHDGEVTLPEPVRKASEMMAKADLYGFVLPRKYGGLHMPTVVTSMAAEMLARADGSFLNFGLHQDNAATINKWASEEIKSKYLPRFCTGEVESAMVLTEPDAGSDLQSVQLRATQRPDGTWVLNGVKRFITNGCARMHLVLARSEEGTTGGRGLSFFLYERDNKHCRIRRIENKLGIHGSATCEIQYKDAPALLIGERKFGLIKYTMWLMNAARLGIAGQALGIAEAACREAAKYAAERIQFGKAIAEMTPVMEMLTEMRIAVEAGRTLYYETARMVDLKEGYENLLEKHPDRAAELKPLVRKYTRYADLLTPIVKAYNTEMCNKVAYDAIQVHGGTGYMREFNAERHYRDARITNIYEGTTQLQVVAAIGGIVTGVAKEKMDELGRGDFGYSEFLHGRLREAQGLFEQAVDFVVAKKDSKLQEYHARRLMEMATDILQGYLLMRDGKHSDRKKVIAETFIEKMLPRVRMNHEFITRGEASLLRNAAEILG